jgi:hypothetical protein
MSLVEALGLHPRSSTQRGDQHERDLQTIFPVITGRNGSDAIFVGAEDFDLKLIESRTLDGSTQELVYRPTLHA